MTRGQQANPAACDTERWHPPEHSPFVGHVLAALNVGQDGGVFYGPVLDRPSGACNAERRETVRTLNVCFTPSRLAAGMETGCVAEGAADSPTGLAGFRVARWSCKVTSSRVGSPLVSGTQSWRRRLPLWYSPGFFHCPGAPAAVTPNQRGRESARDGNRVTRTRTTSCAITRGATARNTR